MLTITGKKQRTPAIAIFEWGESGSNQTSKIGAKAMIGTAFAAIAIGISAVPSTRKRADDVAKSDAGQRADDEAAERLLERVPARRPERVTRRPRARCAIVGRLREQELLHVERDDRALPDARSRRRGSRRPAPSRRCLAAHRPCRARRGRSSGPPSAASSSGSRCSPPRRSSSRTSVTSSKKRGSSRVSTVRGYGRSIVDDAGDPARARAHHDDARREEDRLRDRVRDEDDRRAELLPDREQLEVEPLAGHLVERAERLVHQQQRGLERERPRDRDALLHAARELPRMVVAEPGQLDELEHPLDALLPPARGPSRASRAAARCSSRPSASRTAPRPGRRSRSRGRRVPAAQACR